jgi:hypothetical protein
MVHEQRRFERLLSELLRAPDSPTSMSLAYRAV